LIKGLVERGFVQSKVDKCVFYKGKTILLVDVDDVIMCGSSSKDIDDIIASLKDGFDVPPMRVKLMITWESRSPNLPKTQLSSDNCT
jgi:hypothetical protein